MTEHFKRKEKEQQHKPLDSAVLSKLTRIVKELLDYNEEVRTELPALAGMLDAGHEVDITDVEDLFVREKLERVLELLEGFVARVEAEDGSFSFSKVSQEPLKDQIVDLIRRASDSRTREDWMNSMSDVLASEIGPTVGPPSPSPTKHASEQESQEELEAYMEAYNREHRPKSLLEIHQETKKKTKEPRVLYGHKHLNKRFAEGKFKTQFM
jgi:hypothetical protein